MDHAKARSQGAQARFQVGTRGSMIWNSPPTRQEGASKREEMRLKSGTLLWDAYVMSRDSCFTKWSSLNKCSLNKWCIYDSSMLGNYFHKTVKLIIVFYCCSHIANKQRLGEGGGRRKRYTFSQHWQFHDMIWLFILITKCNLKIIFGATK